MLLHEVVATTDAVVGTSSRLAKIEALATLLRRLDADEIAPAIGFLTAKPAAGADRRRMARPRRARRSRMPTSRR